MKPTVLTLTVDLREAKIDAEARAIRDVVLIRAGMSLNRKHYTEHALQEAHRKGVFEGVRSYDEHMPGRRKLAETTGWYANVRYQEGALIADRFFTRTQAGNDVWSIAEDIVAGRAPATLAGLSINASGVVKLMNDAQGAYHMVESITKATSVDDVATPAAGGTYLQASHDDGLAEALIGSMTFEQFVAARPEFTERLRNELKNVRLTEQVVAAQAEATHNRETLKEADASIATLTERLDATTTELVEARLALVIEKVLHIADLPTSWSDKLREEMTATPPKGWEAVLANYQRMAREAGHTPTRTRVAGAGQQIAQAPKLSTTPRIEIDWEKIKSPADLARLQESLALSRSN